MKTINYINEALNNLDNEVGDILSNISLSMNQKDEKMLLILKQKEILQKTLKELEDLEKNPPRNLSCGISKYRED